MSNTELIEEARKHASDAPLGIGAYQVSLLTRLADALEAAEREYERAWTRRHEDSEQAWGEVATLTEQLAAVRADAWDEGFEAVPSVTDWHRNTIKKSNPYRVSA